MRNFKIFFVIFLISSLFSTGCTLEEEPIPDIEENLFNLVAGFEDWILPFDSLNQEIIYKNSLDSTVVVVVERTFDLDERTYIDCRVDNEQAQCQSASINLAFPENTNSMDFQVFVSIFLFGPNELRIMANRVGIDASVAIFTDDDLEEIESELPDNFSAIYEEDFAYNGMEIPAVIIETNSLEGAVSGAIIPPLRMVLLKGVGVVEWEDYNGNTWVLQN